MGILFVVLENSRPHSPGWKLSDSWRGSKRNKSYLGSHTSYNFTLPLSHGAPIIRPAHPARLHPSLYFTCYLPHGFIPCMYPSFFSTPATTQLNCLSELPLKLIWLTILVRNLIFTTYVLYYLYVSLCLPAWVILYIFTRYRNGCGPEWSNGRCRNALMNIVLLHLPLRALSVTVPAL